MKLNKMLLVAIGAVVVLAVAGLAGCSAGGALAGDVSGLNVNLNSQQQGIWVSGEGKVTAVPDEAILTLGIESQDTTVAAAQAAAADAMAKVMQALKDQGIEDKDIQTQYFNITNLTKWVEPKPGEGKYEVTGYRVTNTVSAKVRDVEKTGTVIDAVVAAGGDYTRINNIALTVDDPSPYYAQARDKAIEYAQAKANQLADKTGVTLGKITYMTESSYNPGPIYRNYAVADSAGGVPAPDIQTSISAGELDISATVQIAYAIAD